MKIQNLNKYRELYGELECIDKQLAKKKEWVSDAVLGDSGEPEHKQVVKPVEGYIHGIGSVVLEVEKRRVEGEMLAIKAYIAAIPVSKIRKALEIYCLSEKKISWEKVADALGEDDGQALRMAVVRYIRQYDQIES